MATGFVPQWVRELEDTLFLSKGLIIHGNVKDVVCYRDQYYPVRLFVNRYLVDQGYEIVGHYDLLDGLEFHTEEYLAAYLEMVDASGNAAKSGDGGGAAYGVPGDAGDSSVKESADKQPDNCVTQKFSANSKEFFETFSRVRDVFDLKDCPSIAVVVYFSDQLMGSSQQMDLSERTNIILLNKIIAAARNINTLPQLLIMVADDIRKVPSELYFANPRCRQIMIPPPSLEERKVFIQKFYTGFHCGEKNEKTAKKDESVENLAVCTDGLANYDLHNLTLLSNKNKISINDAKTLVKRYKFGQKQSPWDSLSRKKIMGTPWKRLKKDHSGNLLKSMDGRYETENVSLTVKDCLKERVIGQDHAVDAVETMIIRAVEGIQSTKSSEAFTKPKGIFLFAGPTGVGKTELTKALTEWMFGDETSMLRFDMSEYNQEHSDQKLIGSPPGYVGHEQGGQLTNAVKKKPFCVILFDEVDKMHHKIWDIFLQILDDGRLTDGTGDTVYFSETVIIMTSNLGGAEQPRDKSSQIVRKHYLDSVRDFFRKRLGRPEILNRIGMDNVIVFNPIERDFQEKIIWQKLNTLNLSYMGKFGFEINFDESVVTFLLEDPEGFVRNGARGIENLITTHIINPVSRYLFYNPDVKEKRMPIKAQIYQGTTTETLITGE